MKNALVDIYAHSLKNKPLGEWQTLAAHSDGVAELCSGFAQAFKSAEWGRVLGLLHDAGKARASFQKYLMEQNNVECDIEYDGGGHNHSGVGAAWAAEKNPCIGRILAYCIAGHHAGLPDWVGGDSPNGALSIRLEESKQEMKEESAWKWLKENVEPRVDFAKLAPPFQFSPDDSSFSFWIRMLYSCLTDADFLDTERFMDPKRASQREPYPELGALAERFFATLDGKQKNAPDTKVNRIRADVRKQCEAAAENPCGIFTLTVPTGGGKTLSGTAFALRHALKHGQRRIIYVIPYTSIIEQTADVLRGFFGADAVVEHHSNFAPEKETQQSRLASENWDAPVIVTTSVQFFESLYSAKPSKCRKLHNVAESVVVLDEVQLLPPNLLEPCTEALAHLAKQYNTSIVLSTATQPAFAGCKAINALGATPIIKDEAGLYRDLKRVEIELPQDTNTRTQWEELAEEMREYSQVLCIVNSKKDCKELAAAMGEDTIYLTTNVCGEHRSAKIALIKERLANGEPVRVASTQLIEAGVDVDFPVVYRAYTGMASIAQAAGRCNREGKMPGYGKVKVFVPPKESPKGVLLKSEQTMREMQHGGQAEFDEPESYRKFFSKFYSALTDNGARFMDYLVRDASRGRFQFREAAAEFKVIENNTVPVIVQYGESPELIKRYREIGRPTRDVMRKLQRYAVNVYRTQIPVLLEKGFIEEMPPSGSGIYVQTSLSLYGDEFGACFDREGLDATDAII